MRALPTKMLNFPQDGGDVEAGVEMGHEDTAGSEVAFYAEVFRLIKNEMEVIEQFLIKLQDTDEESKSIHNPEALKILRERMDQDVREVSQTYQSINAKLQLLDLANASSRKSKGWERDSPTDETLRNISSSYITQVEEVHRVVHSLVGLEMQSVDAADSATDQTFRNSISSYITQLEEVRKVSYSVAGVEMHSVDAAGLPCFTEHSPTEQNDTDMVDMRKRLEELRMVGSVAGVDKQGVDAAEASIIQLQGVPKRFNYDELLMATRGFCEKLGNGGFGSVYRGMLSPRIPVAVKRKTYDSSQGMKEFKGEVSIISQLRHRNLIELLGWCEDQERKECMLVYELMLNGSLDKLLFKPVERGGEEEDRGEGGAARGTPCLSWPQRFKILTDTADALDYLHQGWRRQIIHGDIKCANILLDERWNGKLADFGLSRMVDHDGGASTKNFAGSFGYVAPELFTDGKFTDKSDVFAFGAVLLEVACGRRNWPGRAHGMTLVEWVRQSLSKGDLLSTVDKRLREYDTSEMKRVLMIGLACCDLDPGKRPSTRRIVKMLAGDAQDELMKIMGQKCAEKEREHDDHSRKKIWWRPFRSGGDQSWKKIGGGSLRPGDDRFGKIIGWRPFRKEDSILKLDGVPIGAFREESKIGEGVVGCVYRGELPNGIPVAVKKMKTWGEAKEMFTAELSVLSHIKHRHLIQLLGWREDVSKEEYVLVYELMCNGSLDDALLGQVEGIPSLNWDQRVNIVTEIANAVHYLHQGCNRKIIHRNIKLGHVLLDENWKAKLGGFGSAILVDHQVVEFEGTIRGTPGYISPEYGLGIISDKVDVYCFGVLVLEVACGRRVLSRSGAKGTSFLAWVHQSLSERNLLRVVDQRLREYDTHSIEEFLIVGLLCIQHDPVARPSMSQVVQMLAGNLSVPSISEMQKKNFSYY